MPTRYTPQTLTTNSMRAYALDQRAQLIWLIANENQSPISKDDVCPHYILEKDWTASLRKALREGYILRSDTSRGEYKQGVIPEKLSMLVELWVAFHDALWDLERKCVLQYSCSAVYMLEHAMMMPAQTLRQAIGCPPDLWVDVANLLSSSDTPIVEGPFFPEDVYCHFEGGHEVYEEMLAELSPERTDFVPDEYLYQFTGGDLS